MYIIIKVVDRIPNLRDSAINSDHIVGIFQQARCVEIRLSDQISVNVAEPFDKVMSVLQNPKETPSILTRFAG